jgi:hypothetical protein
LLFSASEDPLFTSFEVSVEVVVDSDDDDDEGDSVGVRRSKMLFTRSFDLSGTLLGRLAPPLEVNVEDEDEGDDEAPTEEEEPINFTRSADSASGPGGAGSSFCRAD